MSRSSRTCTRLATYWFLGAALLACALAAEAANTPEARHRAVDALFADRNEGTRPGAAIGIYQKGRAEYAKGYGYADLEQGTRITDETIFNLASVSKHFSAFAIALLAREGKIDLDADLHRYLPYLPDFGRTITTRHLIHHTSGLRTSEMLFELGGQDIGGLAHQAQIPQMVARQRELNFDPGSEFLYCNLAYSLLPEIVTAVTGRSFREFTTERIFKPLGMQHTFFQDDATEIIPRRAQSYDKDGDRWTRALENYDVVGATGLMTNVQDMIRWAGNFTHPTVGDAKLIAQMGERGKLNDGTPINYGFGLTHQTLAGHEALVHTGSSAGYATIFAYFPKDDFAVTLLMNSQNDRNAPVAAIADLYLNGGSGKLPAKPVSSPQRSQVTQAALGHYLSQYGSLVEIARQGNELVFVTGEDSKTPLVFRKDGTFDLGRAGDEYYRFVRDDSKKIVALEEVSPSEGGHTLHQRVEPVSPSAQQLAEIAGDYRSPELDITYRFAVENGKLTARSIWSAKPIVFKPSVTDRFDSNWWPMGTIVVQRDAAGKPVAMRVHSGRIRNVLLERVGPAS